MHAVYPGFVVEGGSGRDGVRVYWRDCTGAIPNDPWRRLMSSRYDGNCTPSSSGATQLSSLMTVQCLGRRHLTALAVIGGCASHPGCKPIDGRMVSTEPARLRVVPDAESGVVRLHVAESGNGPLRSGHHIDLPGLAAAAHAT